MGAETRYLSWSCTLIVTFLVIIGSSQISAQADCEKAASETRTKACITTFTLQAATVPDSDTVSFCRFFADMLCCIKNETVRCVLQKPNAVTTYNNLVDNNLKNRFASCPNANEYLLTSTQNRCGSGSKGKGSQLVFKTPHLVMCLFANYIFGTKIKILKTWR